MDELTQLIIWFIMILFFGITIGFEWGKQYMAELTEKLMNIKNKK